jgi:hypothetical protein
LVQRGVPGKHPLRPELGNPVHVVQPWLDAERLGHSTKGHCEWLRRLMKSSKMGRLMMRVPK